MDAPLLEIAGLRAGYGANRAGSERTGVVAVHDVDLAVRRGEFVTLLGPSGCGKTTLLRSIAGLHHPRRGVVRIAGRTVFSAEEAIDVPPNRRRIGMVLQSHAVWPHLDVFSNVAFPLRSLPRRARPDRATIASKVVAALDLVELGGLADRPASRLSGGQQQRLALARAVVAEPDLLLLDEPLSNLDARLRAATRSEVKRLQRELGITVVHVTHDQEEALSMSDRVGVMSAGRLVQVGTPSDVYDRPINRFVATFVGRANVLPVLGVDSSTEVRRIETPIGWLVTDDRATLSGSDVAVFRPEQVVVCDARPTEAAEDLHVGEVVDVSFRGDAIDITVDIAGSAIQARLEPASKVVQPGDTVGLHLPPASVQVVADDRIDQGRKGS